MNFQLSEEHIMIRDAARDFAKSELLPGVIERDETQTFPHEQIKKWRLEKSELVTKERRSDMWADYIKSADEIKKID